MAIGSQRGDASLNLNTDLLNAYQLLEQIQQDRNATANHVLAIRSCLQPEDFFEEDSSNDLKQKSLHANIVDPVERIIKAYSIEIEHLSSALGEVQELLAPSPRSALKARYSSNASIQSSGSNNSFEPRVRRSVHV